MRRDHVQPVGSQLDRQEPGKRGQRHDLPASAMNEEFSRVGGVAQFKRPGVANIAPLVPANAVDMAIRHRFAPRLDRKSVVSGKSVSVRVDLGGRRIIKKKKTQQTTILK